MGAETAFVFAVTTREPPGPGSIINKFVPVRK